MWGSGRGSSRPQQGKSPRGGTEYWSNRKKPGSRDGGREVREGTLGAQVAEAVRVLFWVP